MKQPESIVTNEDCMELMKRYPDNYFDLAVVDPPYGINVNVSMGRRKGDKKSNYHKFYGNDTSSPDWKFFYELKRISKNQVIWGGNYMLRSMSIADYEIVSPCWLLWDKGFSEDVTFAQYEMAWTSFKTSAKKFDKHPSQLNRIHPTQKPVALYDWIFANYAKEGDRILDTHLGSQSSRIAADRAGLDFVGCELDKEYFHQGCKRFNEYKAQLRLFK